MKRSFVLCVLVVLLTPLHAQDISDPGELTPLDITAVHITRADDDRLTLDIEGIGATCGDIITTEWYSDVYIDFITTETVDELPAGDLPRRLAYQRYITFTLSTLPDENAACDLDAPQVVTIEVPRTIKMPDVPNYEFELDEKWDVVLLVNDFAAWFYLAEDAETEIVSGRGQPLEVGEIALTRWQKVDSTIENLYSLGADPGYWIPWLEGYHADGCEAPTRVNIVRDAYMRDTIEHDLYTANVFRLLPADSVCPDMIQPFVVSAFGVLPQRDLILSLGDISYRILVSDGTVTPVERNP